MIPRRVPLATLVATAVSLILFSTAGGRAWAQSISGGSASTSGTTGNSGDGSGSRRASVAVQVNNGSQFKTRFAWNLSSDVGVFSTQDTNGSAQHNLSFNVTAPGAYFLTVDTSRVGDMNRANDASGCDGSADISSVTGGFSGGSLTSGSLSLGDPGSIPNGGSTTSGPINQSTTARIDNTSNGASQGHTLTFTWNGSTRSNSCESAVRLGEGSSVSGCDACVYPGSPSRTQSSDGHFVTVTLTSLCGNGVVDSAQGEDCDTAIANSVCCSSSCHFLTSSTTCRPTAGVCDVAEHCSGSSATCPADSFVSSSTVCRPGTAGVCDTAENCTGFSAACPADTYAPNTTVCRPSSGVCDTAENCTGSSPTCPANSFASSSSICRPAAGVCDTSETCTGSSAACPANGFVAGGTECRPSAGVCDVAESCTGSSATCPTDAKSTAVCRAANGVCDAVESCDGVGDDCPFDDVLPATTVCRGAGGVCDIAENCDGVTTDCPPDNKSFATCRPSAGVCDVDEVCDGVADNCPADAFQPSTSTCRAAAGACDLAESCTGSSAACPADALAPATTVCRPDAGDCDVAETCTGSDVDCPADVVEPDGTSCSDANSCTLDDACVAGACVGNSMLCGDGVVQGGCGETCDDSNTNAGDGCSATCQVEPGLGCAAAPLAFGDDPGECRAPFFQQKATLQIIKKDGAHDQIKWKWLKGVRTDLADYAAPLTSTNYEVCIYDSTGLRFAITNPAGGDCAGKPCWRTKGSTGFSYKDKELTPNGGYQLQLKTGGLAKAAIQFTARGASLGMDDLTTLTPPFTVQIQNSNGLCWGAVYSTPSAQTAVLIKSKAD